MSFYSDLILSKQGPLGKVWLASHLERKLGKQTLLSLSIPSAAKAILGSDDAQVEVMALRLSGQLLLGVVRIYSRKAKYLMDDCSEALVKIKMAFRSAAGQTAMGATSAAARARDVDMPEQDADAARANINLNLALSNDRAGEFDRLYNAEFNMYGAGYGLWEELNLLATPNSKKPVKPAGTGKSTTSRHADITLPEHENFFYENDSVYGDAFGFGSQEFRAASIASGEELDLGLDDFELDLGLMDDDRDVGDNRAVDAQRQDDDLLSSPTRNAAAHRGAQKSNKVAAMTAAERQRSSSEVPSVELGRRDLNDRSLSMGPEALGLPAGEANESTFDKTAGDARAMSFEPVENMDFDFGGGNDFDLNDGQLTPRARSPLTPLSQLGDDLPEDIEGPVTQTDLDMTPRTAKRVEVIAAQGSATRKRKEATLAAGNAGEKPRPSKMARQVVDPVIELTTRLGGMADSQTQSQNGNSISLATREERVEHGLLINPKYLPRTSLEMRYEEIQQDPVKHFLAGMHDFADNNNKENRSFYAGPPGLPKQLQGLFQFTLGKKGILGVKRPATAVQPGALPAENEDARRKRARSSAAPEEVELGRERQASIARDHDFFDFGGDGPDYTDFAGNDFELDMNMDATVDVADATRTALEKTPSRMSTPGLLDASLHIDLDLDGIDRENVSVLSIFDPVTKANQASTPHRQTASQLSAPGTRASQISLEESNVSQAGDRTISASQKQSTGGWSKNTVKALRVLEHEFLPDPEASLSFDRLANRASRKAASSMIYESLILATRGCIKLQQAEPYGDIEISSKPKLFEVCQGLNKLSVNEDEGDEHSGGNVTLAGEMRDVPTPASRRGQRD